MDKYVKLLNFLKLKNNFEKLKENLRLYKKSKILNEFFSNWKIFMNKNKIKKHYFSLWREEMKILRVIIMVFVYACMYTCIHKLVFICSY
jgi:hypothetical protein